MKIIVTKETKFEEQSNERGTWYTAQVAAITKSRGFDIENTTAYMLRCESPLQPGQYFIDPRCLAAPTPYKVAVPYVPSWIPAQS